VKKKVMIVDDDLEFLDEFAVILYLNGYDVTSVTDGEYALNIVEEIMPDLILLDFKMKKISGFEVAEKLKNSEKTGSIPIIGMTAVFTKEEDRDFIKASGVDEIYTKPFELRDILNEIESRVKI